MTARRYEQYRRAIEGEALPLAIVDLDALERNCDLLAGKLARSDKTLRLATKSVRCPELARRIVGRGGAAMRGLMTYTARETEVLAEGGETDLLLAYPTAQPSDAAALARANARPGVTAAVVADDPAQLDVLDAAARSAGAKIPVVVDLDLSYRPARGVHLGVRRSPIRTPAEVVAFARAIAARPSLVFHGVMGYEAQIAGVRDDSAAKRAMKALSRADVRRTRAAVARALEAEGLAPRVFNGGGTGSLADAAKEAALTEVTAGSGFLDSHLFDGYRGLSLEPAAYFALQVTRRPAKGIVTCHGGGYVASGAAGKDRLPVPALPPGLALLGLEGAGEVQTPLAGDTGGLRLGDPVFFRHAKAGELAEHFAEYLLVRGAAVEARAKTYRGLGWCFLG